ncbi:hypothetical protein IWZ03DRAFT_231627 [Phyllosticta citriasiana]|uniref:Transmembrane protein n=1 Tax=Phyllosticta citriasiana TaxID=595635 RepID=A0ABR1KHG5_9PEZI
MYDRPCVCCAWSEAVHFIWPIHPSIHPSIHLIKRRRETGRRDSQWVGRSGQGLQALRHRVLSSIILRCFFSSTSSFHHLLPNSNQDHKPSTNTDKAQAHFPLPTINPPSHKKTQRAKQRDTHSPHPHPLKFQGSPCSLSPAKRGTRPCSAADAKKEKKSQSIKVWRCITAIAIAFRGVGAACLLLISFTNGRRGK